jgi:hypothetical protein
MERLLAEIDSDQIPACFGGTCKVPWPFGDGGEIVDEGEYETMHVSKLEVAKTTVAPKTTCLVEVKVVSRDINLKIEVAGDGAGGGDTTVVVCDNVKVKSVEGWRSFQYTMPANAETHRTLSVTFDNSFSWLLGKTVHYRFLTLEQQ